MRGQELKEIIYAQGMNVLELAGKTGIPASTLYCIIRRNAEVSIEIAIRVSYALEIPLREFGVSRELLQVILRLEIMEIRKQIKEQVTLLYPDKADSEKEELMNRLFLETTVAYCVNKIAVAHR